MKEVNNQDLKLGLYADNELTFSEYQEHAKETAVYPKDVGAEYCIMELAGEAGELLNKFKKILRGDRTLDEAREELIDEAGDCLWPLAMLCEELGVPFEEVARRNLKKLASRKERGVIKGSGDLR